MSYLAWLAAWQRLLIGKPKDSSTYKRFERLHRAVWPDEHFPGYEQASFRCHRRFTAEHHDLRYHGGGIY